MKIVLCSYDGKGYFGGPYEWARRIGLEWRKRGYEVSYLIVSDHSPSESTLYNYVKDKGFTAYVTSKKSLLQYDDNTEYRIQWFLDKVTQLKPDVFIANPVLEALYACPAIEAMGIKTYGIYHSDDNKHLWFNDLFVKNRDFGPTNIVYVSSFLKEKFSGATQNNFVIGCGCNAMPSKAEFSTSPFRIVYFGKLAVYQKQIYKHIEAFRYVLEKSNLPFEFHIYGSGPEKDQVVKMLDGDSRIQYKGFIDSDQVESILKQYQAFVLLSDFEGLSVALMEAMSVGLVPVCLDTPSGTPELINDKVNGMVVKDRGQAFLDALTFLYQNSAEWEKMSVKAKQLITEQYSTEAVADLWDTAFKEGVTDTAHKSSHLPEVHPLLISRDKRKQSLTGYLKKQCQRIWSAITKKI